MNTQQINDDDSLPLTRREFRQFMEAIITGLQAGLADAPARRTGDVALPHEILGLHSDAPAEHDATGNTRVRLFDLIGDRTGVERDDGRVYFAD